MNYSDFAGQCVSDLKALQDEFQERYDVDWYDDWFYNQVTGLLTFSTGNVELNFRYFDVGSYSERSNTWKWSWDNESTLDSVEEQLGQVKAFGKWSDFEKLTTGYFPSDEFEAWEFAAIAAKLTGGIGVYRPVNNNGLQIYLVITEFVDQQKAQEIKDRYVQCRVHDHRRRAFICQHLNNETRVGFVEAFETVEDMPLEEDDDFQAWCSQCEAVRQRESEWNDTSMAFASIKVVCEKCYFELKEINLRHC